MNRYGTLLRATLIAGVASVALAGCGMMSKSNVASFSGTMNAASEVPPNMTRGSGLAEAWLNRDTNVLKYKITYSGLSGPATAGHFHGPAAAGANAGVVLPFARTESPIEGQATLTPAQAADLLAGKWYANIHTAANPAGEIRGQMLPKM
ncbi:CHRD domain-containing protein [Variovorax sp. S2]|jgi:hypothetical protein|uniref:CHRD domain-containing protein n=1 Tax=unclassified Variovorax TaxID=663243 RepID=UPI00215BB337|nr:CHRD domain-containing protein [Variovorax sp. S12S4]MCR8960271.1 CHRD domain-containing protein [Variovorax sp. S12S4]